MTALTTEINEEKYKVLINSTYVKGDYDTNYILNGSFEFYTKGELFNKFDVDYEKLKEGDVILNGFVILEDKWININTFIMNLKEKPPINDFK